MACRAKKRWIAPKPEAKPCFAKFARTPSIVALPIRAERCHDVVMVRLDPIGAPVAIKAPEARIALIAFGPAGDAGRAHSQWIGRLTMRRTPP